MGLFGNNEEKTSRREEELLRNYGLTNLSNPDDIAAVQRILRIIVSTDMSGRTAVITAQKGPEQPMLYHMERMLEQNFIIISQLDRISRQLDELNKK